MEKLAICIPTYNRKESLEDILSRIANAFSKNDVDVYVFDSSEEEYEYNIESIIDDINIFFIRVDSCIHGNEKLYHIYNNDIIKKQYQYIWLLPDYMFYGAWVIDEIKNGISEERDFIIINFWNNSIHQTFDCDDANYIFKKYCSSLTQYGTVIFRINVFDLEHDYEKMYEKYINQLRMNFSHIGLYFETIAKLQAFNARIIECSKSDYYSSPNRKSVLIKNVSFRKPKNSEWESAFHAWAVCWPETIKALPDIYTEKWDVVHKPVKDENLLNERMLISERAKGTTRMTDVLKRALKWKYISCTPLVKTLMICLMPKRYASWCLDNKSIIRRLKVDANIDYLKKASKENDIYLYGAGRRAYEYLEFFKEKGIPIKDIVVSDCSLYKDLVYGYKVMNVEELRNSKKNFVLVLAMNEDNKRVVCENLDVYFKNKIFNKPVFIW